MCNTPLTVRVLVGQDAVAARPDVEVRGLLVLAGGLAHDRLDELPVAVADALPHGHRVDVEEGAVLLRAVEHVRARHQHTFH